MTATITELDVLADLDFEPACQVWPCARVARWLLASVPCGCSWLICDDCRRRHLRQLRRAKPGTPIAWHCYSCGAKGVADDPAAVYRLEPLR